MTAFSTHATQDTVSQPSSETAAPYHFIGIRDASVLVKSPDPEFASKFVVASTSVLARFEPSGAAGADGLSGANLLRDGDFRERLRHWRLERPSSGARLGVNIAPEWTLEGQNTAFLEVDRGCREACVVFWDPSSEGRLEFSCERSYRLQGYFGAHRCRGFIEVAYCDAHGRELGSVRQEFGTLKGGGTRLHDYELVQVEFAPPAGVERGKLRLGYLGPTPLRTDDDADLPGFIFFTSLGLFAVGPTPEGRDGEPDGASHASGSTGGVDRLYIARVDARAASSSRTPLVIKPITAGAGEDATVFTYAAMAGVRATLAGLDGPLLKVMVEGKAGGLWLRVDGIAVAELDEGKAGGMVAVPLPTGLQDGCPHLVEISDETGLAILAQDYLFLPAVQTPWDALQRYVNGRLPAHLAPAAAHRYAALQHHLDDPRRDGEGGARRLARIGLLHSVLVQGRERIRAFPPLEFPAEAEPAVSVVIPVRDRFEMTYVCLCALLFAPTRTSFEVIVVDDGSVDQTVELPALASNVRVVRNDASLGFIGACNRGAKEARGRYIVFLNNDTEPTAFWLDELAGAFATFDDVGIAGSRLLYPDGRLQEAGGIVWRSGNPWNYGRSGNPHDPRYGYARQVDYVSGAALMIRRDLWESIGGFSEDLQVAYFEDTYLAFEARSRGYRTVYVPHSVVYHFEGVSAGTSVDSGMKRYQELNRPVFRRRWADLYREHGKEGEAPDLEKDRGVAGRVLFIDFQAPRPDADAGSYAALQEMRLIQALGFKVTLLPENLAWLGRYSEQLQRMGIEAVHAPFCTSVQEFLRQRGREFDVVYLTRFSVAENCIDMVRAYAPQAKVVFNLADLHFLRELRAAIAAGSDGGVETALAVRDRELAIIERVDLTLSYNPVEEAVILSHVPRRARVARCPWVVEPQSRVAPLSGRSGIAFLGSYGHPPNAEAVRFFVGSVMPRLRVALPGVAFHIFGSGITPEIRALAAADVIVRGYVESTSEVHDSARVFVAPLKSGAGIKGKVLGALAAGIPTVLSELAAEGIGLDRGRHYLHADTADEWVEAIRSLYLNEKLWEQVSADGRDFVGRHFAFEAGVALMKTAFEQVGVYAFREGGALCARSIEEPAFLSPSGGPDAR